MPRPAALLAEKSSADWRRSTNDPHLINAPGRWHGQIVGDDEQAAGGTPVGARDRGRGVFFSTHRDWPHVTRRQDRDHKVCLSRVQIELSLKTRGRRLRLHRLRLRLLHIVDEQTTSGVG